MKPPINADEHRLDEITDKVIGCAFVVSNILGAGFVEKVYENALAHELRSAGLSVAQQYAIAVSYKGIIVGEYVADLLVASEVVVELKAVRALDDIHAAQMHELPESDWAAGLSAVQFWQTSRRSETYRSRILTVHRTSVFIGVYRRFQSLR